VVQLLPDVLARVHATLGAGWDWSGTAAVPAPLPSHGVGNGVTVSSEEAREQGEVQRSYYSFLHTLTGNGLGGVILRVCFAMHRVLASHTRYYTSCGTGVGIH
jgi:hypothetical protein